ncbi:HNH endonuclease signature motif containing protein [Mycobacterium sp. pUA109]|uniref:HNH endonuclease signature motif containing protein n=1 Tax=Mycobacterium sp. pUA109 TaxID=3238982 RepID=UPI00351B0327
MAAADREAIVEVFDDLDAAMKRALELDFDALTTPECLNVLERCETLRRQLPAVEHPLVNQLAQRAERSELGGKLAWALADRLRITRGEARRRIGEATDLGPRTALTGEPLEPLLASVAAAQRAGQVGSAHVQVIRGFFGYLPDDIDLDTLIKAEAHLVDLATQYRPDELAKLAQRLADCLHPDGNYSDTDRAKRRTVIVGPQDRYGMSPINGYLDPQGRAVWDAVMARWAGPGMCNPDDPQPCLDGAPSQAAIDADHRSAGQRNHDALTALCRAMLASGQLGQHNGLPATVIISARLKDFETGTGKGFTGGGSWLPMTDVIRMASHAHHYLRIYDGAKEIALYHTKRLASPGQRIVLYAKERGCSHPNCSVPGYCCEVHHDDDYAQTGVTDIAGLTFRCHPHHGIITTGGWKTRKNHHGQTETLPPPHLDHGQPRTNHYHHPENLLHDNHDNKDDEDDDGP